MQVFENPPILSKTYIQIVPNRKKKPICHAVCIEQFINILKGDMSFIGPRPTLTYHPWRLEEYSDAQRRRFEVRPGITGLAQVHGRKTIDWNDRIKYDVEYVDKLSLGLDCKILFQTVWNVLTMKDNNNVGKTSEPKENKDA